jgi:hypothetical protein
MEKTLVTVDQTASADFSSNKDSKTTWERFQNVPIPKPMNRGAIAD